MVDDVNGVYRGVQCQAPVILDRRFMDYGLENCFRNDDRPPASFIA